MDEIIRKPSVEQPWNKIYAEGAVERANDIPLDKTVWDIIEKQIDQYYDIPVLEYFKKQIDSESFKNSVYTWARAFRGMGVEEDEVVPIYGPFFPDIIAMTFALNLIGATPYFLKLAIDSEGAKNETEGCKVAVVFDEMWPNVKDAFLDDRFKNVIVATAADSMLQPKKEIVTFLNYIKAKKNHSPVPDGKKFIWIDEAKKMADYYTGEVKVDFKENRTAFITSSSGTTGGQLKSLMATNESAIAQLFQASNADINYIAGHKCLTNFPPTAATSLNCLCFLPLYKRMTLIVDPRVDGDMLYKQINMYHPSVIISTGSKWEEYFTRLENDIMRGKKPDLSFADMWIIGGEGTVPNKYVHWCELMKKCGAPYPIFSGYGSSEVFSVTSVDNKNAFEKALGSTKPVLGVGLPYPGVTAGVFDENGNELGYNQRGELWLKTKTMSKGYYNNPEITNEVFKDGFYRTGDIFEIDENGFLYLWGRKNDKVKVGENEIYLFDINNAIRTNPAITDAMVVSIPTVNNTISLVAHISMDCSQNNENIPSILSSIDEYLESLGYSVDGYKIHDKSLPYSPTTLKKDKSGMSKDFENIIKVVNDEVYDVKYTLSIENAGYIKNYSLNESMEMSKKRI